ncbi:unnamed protein product [Heligmosomoides polygyrus]|uniref:F-box family protein n=1 Tax=Heligmosomoides polygyrus TaxID=6339 RepID=A0A183GWM6_HELPZ|nr:unnamed protein product [Heligmosomoides polygyrus]
MVNVIHDSSNVDVVDGSRKMDFSKGTVSVIDICSRSDYGVLDCGCVDLWLKHCWICPCALPFCRGVDDDLLRKGGMQNICMCGRGVQFASTSSKDLANARCFVEVVPVHLKYNVKNCDQMNCKNSTGQMWSWPEFVNWRDVGVIVDRDFERAPETIKVRYVAVERFQLEFAELDGRSKLHLCEWVIDRR